MRLFLSLATFSILLFATACGESFNPISQPDQRQELGEPAAPVDPVNPQPPLKICSELNFEGVQWNSRFDDLDKNAFAVALNVSGSYEGNSGWANLTNNFDGQGLSMGLLNQTLGTGSLQPLLYLFKKDFPQSYSQVLSSIQRSAMDTMINQWATAKGLLTSSMMKSLSPMNLLQLHTEPTADKTSELIDTNSSEVNKYYKSSVEFHVMGAAESQSVQWALNTIYTSTSGNTFKSEWKTALKKLSAHPDYVSLQIEAAEYLHERALRYVERAGFTELRAYLTMFDISVQNGTIKDSHFNSFNSWKAQNPNASEEAALLKLVDIRAASSLAQYRDDVLRRKRTIVLGKGFVHGENRNLPNEYCYNPHIKYPLNIVNP